MGAMAKRIKADKALEIGTSNTELMLAANVAAMDAIMKRMSDGIPRARPPLNRGGIIVWMIRRFSEMSKVVDRIAREVATVKL